MLAKTMLAKTMLAKTMLAKTIGSLTFATLAIAQLVGCGGAGFQDNTEGRNVQTARIDSIAARPVQQKEAVWCWAACTEMVLRYNGNTSVTQEQIAQRIFGTIPENATPEEREKIVQSAGSWQVALALLPEYNGPNFDRVAQKILTGQNFNSNTALYEAGLAWIDQNSGPASDLTDALVEQGQGKMQPVVVGLSLPDNPDMGHAYVAYGVDYSLADRNAMEESLDGTVVGKHATSGKYVVHKVYLIDPWEGVATQMPAEEFSKRADFAMSRAKAARQMQRMQGVLNAEDLSDPTNRTNLQLQLK